MESTKIIQCHYVSNRVKGNIFMEFGSSFSMSRLCADSVWSGDRGQVTYLESQSSFQNHTDSSFIMSPPNGEGYTSVACCESCPSSLFKNNNASFNFLLNYDFIRFAAVTKSYVEFDTRTSNQCRDIYYIANGGTETIEKTNAVNNTHNNDKGNAFFFFCGSTNIIEVTEGIFISNTFLNYKYVQEGIGDLILEKCISFGNSFSNALFTSVISPFTHTLSERAGFQCLLTRPFLKMEHRKPMITGFVIVSE